MLIPDWCCSKLIGPSYFLHFYIKVRLSICWHFVWSHFFLSIWISISCNKIPIYDSFPVWKLFQWKYQYLTLNLKFLHLFWTKKHCRQNLPDLFIWRNESHISWGLKDRDIDSIFLFFFIHLSVLFDFWKIPHKSIE